jgi:peptidyl-prolyl cis-trans isomerase A (cyclophilin A)
MTVRKAADFAAAYSDTGGVQGTLRGLSVRGLRIDLARDSVVRVRIDTDAGAITAELNPSKAPVTVANFLRYVDAGLYNGGSFHRAVRMDNQPNDSVKIQVIQGGMSTERRGEGFPPIVLERTNVTGLLHVDGALSMARGGADSATNNFFITIGAQPSLDFGGHRNLDGQGFAVFGRVVSGMDVVKIIQSGETAVQTLKAPVRITGVTRIKP